MTAVIIAAGLSPGMEPLNERYPTPLLPLLDRPFIQHVVEFLVEGGMTRFEFVLSHLPEKIEGFLGDGSRWGCTFRFHLARDPSHPYDILKTLHLGEDAGTLFLAHADRLPLVDLEQTRPANPIEEPVMFFSPPIRRIDPSAENSQDTRQWTGWAWVPADILKNLPKGLDEGALEAHLASTGQSKGSLVQLSNSLSVRSYGDVLASQATVLGKEFKGLLLGGKEADESIWLSRNLTLHPMATLNPPVYIGENCRIGKETSLGPNAVIGKDCVLDSDCTVTNSLIFPGSYVGEGLELDEVLVDKNRLINVKFGAAVSISESFILGGLSKAHLGQWFAGIFSRFAAACLLLVLWPFLLATALLLKVGRRGPVLFKKEAVRLPVQTDEALWQTFGWLSFAPDRKERGKGGAVRHFFLRFLPGLINIIKGELRFVGVKPRTRDEIKALPKDWQALYLNAKSGVITEAFINYGAFPTEDELYTSEVFYSVSAGIGHDFKLLSGYLGRLLGFSDS
jgi:lipopolysaccharide/colanic/teichoic acid biosynthesis glycosyltransferase